MCLDRLHPFELVLLKAWSQGSRTEWERGPEPLHLLFPRLCFYPLFILASRQGGREGEEGFGASFEILCPGLAVEAALSLQGGGGPRPA